MKFRFPIVIIDEDYRSENSSGLGIRALAKAMEDEGMEVLASQLRRPVQFAQHSPALPHSFCPSTMKNSVKGPKAKSTRH